MSSMNTKHVGKLSNTGKKCVVVFRELPDDPSNCLVVDTDALPDWMHDDIINAVEAPGAQASHNFYEYAERTVLSDGTNMLQTLHSTGRLQKQPTNNVVLTPNNEVAVSLEEINKLVREQTDGKDVVAPPADERPMVGKDTTSAEAPVITEASAPTPDTLDPDTMAKNLLAQAKTFEQEAKNLKSQAYEMAPGLKPGPKKASKKEAIASE